MLYRSKAPSAPERPVDVVIDTDAYNEIDDQFAVAYLLANADFLRCRALYAAPFFNDKSEGPKDGMEKSYGEILKVLRLCKREYLASVTFRGAEDYLPNEKTPVPSDAARDLVERSRAYSRENPLYVVAIAAITNVASAILLDPTVVDRIVVVWLGGHSREWWNTREFNLMQDVAAARVLFQADVPLVQLPCSGVVSAFSVSAPELEKWMFGKNALSDYLARNVVSYMEKYEGGRPWSKPVWDVTAVAWLLNKKYGFMAEREVPAYLPSYECEYEVNPNGRPITYIWDIHRTDLFYHLFTKLESEFSKEKN